MKAFLIAIVLIILAGGVYAGWQRIHTDEPVTATTSPTTEIPEPSGTSETVDLALDQTGTVRGVTITPIELVSDSRCPRDVQCVWAGSVSVKARIVSGTGESTIVFTLGVPVTIEAEEIMLVDATPYPMSGVAVIPELYRFIFKVTKR